MKDVQRYKLFRGIALKNYAFSFFNNQRHNDYIHTSYSQSIGLFSHGQYLNPLLARLFNEVTLLK